MEKRPTQSREGVKGGLRPFFFPLQGQGAAPLVGFGATPQLFRGRPVCQSRSTKGAGSEASLPVTLRSRRSAPKRLYPLLAHCRAKWARPHSQSTTSCPCFPLQTDTKTQKDTRKTSGAIPLSFLIYRKYPHLPLCASPILFLFLPLSNTTDTPARPLRLPSLSRTGSASPAADSAQTTAHMSAPYPPEIRAATDQPPQTASAPHYTQQSAAHDLRRSSASYIHTAANIAHR